MDLRRSMCWFSRMFGRVGWNGLAFGVIARGLSTSVWSFRRPPVLLVLESVWMKGAVRRVVVTPRRSLVIAFIFTMLLKMPHLSTLKARSFFMCMSGNTLGGYQHLYYTLTGSLS